MGLLARDSAPIVSKYVMVRMWSYRQVDLIIGQGLCRADVLSFKSLFLDKSGLGEMDFKSDLTESKHHLCQLLFV